MAELHQDAALVEFLIGTWTGTGRGEYPTIEPFEYAETVSFGHIGKPFLRYDQKTRRLDGVDAGMPLHGESGFLRASGKNVEFVIAQPTGIVEIHDGIVDGSKLRLTCRLVGGTDTAVEVSNVERRIWVEGDVLAYELWMTAVGQPHQFHLEAQLTRQE